METKVQIHFKFAHVLKYLCSVHVDKMDPWLSNLLNATEDCSPCNLIPMNCWVQETDCGWRDRWHVCEHEHRAADTLRLSGPARWRICKHERQPVEQPTVRQALNDAEEQNGLSLELEMCHFWFRFVPMSHKRVFTLVFHVGPKWI